MKQIENDGSETEQQLSARGQRQESPEKAQNPIEPESEPVLTMTEDPQDDVSLLVIIRLSEVNTTK